MIIYFIYFYLLFIFCGGKDVKINVKIVDWEGKEEFKDLKNLSNRFEIKLYKTEKGARKREEIGTTKTDENDEASFNFNFTEKDHFEIKVFNIKTGDKGKIYGEKEVNEKDLEQQIEISLTKETNFTTIRKSDNDSEPFSADKVKKGKKKFENKKGRKRINSGRKIGKKTEKDKKKKVKRYSDDEDYTPSEDDEIYEDEEEYVNSAKKTKKQQTLTSNAASSSSGRKIEKKLYPDYDKQFSDEMEEEEKTQKNIKKVKRYSDDEDYTPSEDDEIYEDEEEYLTSAKKTKKQQTLTSKGPISIRKSHEMVEKSSFNQNIEKLPLIEESKNLKNDDTKKKDAKYYEKQAKFVGDILLDKLRHYKDVSRGDPFFNALFDASQDENFKLLALLEKYKAVENTIPETENENLNEHTNFQTITEKIASPQKENHETAEQMAIVNSNEIFANLPDIGNDQINISRRTGKTFNAPTPFSDMEIAGYQNKNLSKDYNSESVSSNVTGE
uniref:Uncharacterized protein n=1 Tax=Meloidogyne hapla TaxID=6305 RepID=A0A1I8BCU1_MELHA